MFGRDSNLHAKRPARPNAELPADHSDDECRATVPPGTVTNLAVVSGGGDSNSTNNSAHDPVIIAAPAPGMDLTITKTHTPIIVVPGQTFRTSSPC